MRWSFRAPTEPLPYKRWFAWYPVEIDYSNEWAWLELVERKRYYSFPDSRHWRCWLYRWPNDKAQFRSEAT